MIIFDREKNLPWIFRGGQWKSLALFSSARQESNDLWHFSIGQHPTPPDPSSLHSNPITAPQKNLIMPTPPAKQKLSGNQPVQLKFRKTMMSTELTIQASTRSFPSLRLRIPPLQNLGLAPQRLSPIRGKKPPILHRHPHHALPLRLKRPPALPCPRPRPPRP